jgi:hypothetical protein
MPSGFTSTSVVSTATGGGVYSDSRARLRGGEARLRGGDVQLSAIVSSMSGSDGVATGVAQ